MDEYWIGTRVIGFDGTVLEVFGASHVHRYHLYDLQSLKLSETRSGKTSLAVMAQGGRGVPMFTLDNEHHVAAAHALIDAVNQARAARGWPPVPTS